MHGGGEVRALGTRKGWGWEWGHERKERGVLAIRKGGKWEVEAARMGRGEAVAPLRREERWKAESGAPE